MVPDPRVLVACCVWPASPEVLSALDTVLGPPVDAYVNGSQVWIDDDGPGAIAIEWRLHPVASFEKPRGVPTAEIFDRAVDGSLDGAALWGGLEAFAAHDDPLEVTELLTWATARLGVRPIANGLVDHEAVADAWERSERATSIVADLLAQLG